MTQAHSQTRRVHGRHHTSPTGTGHSGRKTARAHQTPVDPAKPSGAVYHELSEVQPWAQQIGYHWTRTGTVATRDRHGNALTWMIARTPEYRDWDRNLVTITASAMPHLGSMKFHRLVVDQFRGFFQAIVNAGHANLALTCAGTYFPRTRTGAPAKASNHSFGTAIDINAPQNGYGHGPAPRNTHGTNAYFADFANDFGIYWGGWYSGHKDAMHFEAVRVLTHDELVRACEKNRVAPAEIGLGR